MSANKKRPGAFRRANRDLIFGPPPVLAHENLEAYELILDRLYAEIMPTDFIEESFIQDAAYWTWDLLRSRRMRTCLIEANIPAAMVWVLAAPPHQQLKYIGQTDKVEPSDRPMSLEDKRNLEEAAAKAVKKVEELKKEQGLDETEVQFSPNLKLIDDTTTTRAFLEALDAIDRIDDQITLAQKRRDGAYENIHRHRKCLREAWREKVRHIEGVAFEIIKPRKKRRSKTSILKAAA